MIQQATVSKIASQIAESKLDESIISALRSEYADIHFTYCQDDDIPNNDPIFEQEMFNLYLVDGRNHCMCLTSNLDDATGIVVAEIYQD